MNTNLFHISLPTRNFLFSFSSRSVILAKAVGKSSVLAELLALLLECLNSWTFCANAESLLSPSVEKCEAFLLRGVYYLSVACTTLQLQIRGCFHMHNFFPLHWQHLHTPVLFPSIFWLLLVRALFIYHSYWFILHFTTKTWWRCIFVSDKREIQNPVSNMLTKPTRI